MIRPLLTIPAGIGLGAVTTSIIVIALALGGCSTGYWGPTDTADMKAIDGVLIIEDATGGRVMQTQENFTRLEREGTQVKVYGTCASACLLVLTHKNVCYRPDAKFVFHGASTPTVSRIMQSIMPKRVGQWSIDNDAMTDPDRLTELSGTDMARLDDTDRTCRT